MAYERALQQAYELAYFVHCDRDLALRIAAEAAGMLEVAASAQDKRLYYTPSGRHADMGKATAFRTKVTLGERHLLQRLVMFVSERYERETERTSPERLTERDMLVRFVKHLVRITLKRSSFYVTLGIGRLLHAYSTPETAEIYAVLVQNPDRVHDDAYFRSRKKVLMQEMTDRFVDIVHLKKGARGEERFESRPDDDADIDFARACLERFTLWDTKCRMPERFVPSQDILAAFDHTGADPEDEHTVEINRIHALVHPKCFERLTLALGFDAPRLRLEIPRFFLASTGDRNGDGDRTPPPPSDDDLRALGKTLASQAERRRAFHIGALSVAVDGCARASLDPCRADRVLVDVDGGAEFVEVRAEDGLLLAAIGLERDADDCIRTAELAVTLEAGQRIAFAVAPSGLDGARVEVSYTETAPTRAARLALRRGAVRMFGSVDRAWRVAGATAAGAILVAGLVGAYFVWQHPGATVETPSAPVAETAPTPDAPAPQASEPESQPTQPDIDIAGAGSASPGRHGSASPGRHGSASPGRSGTRSRPTLPDDSSAEPVVRGEDEEWVAAQFRDVKVIHVDPLGDGDDAKAVHDALVKQISASGRFAIAPTRDAADAVLKGTVTTDRAQGHGVTVMLRLVNADGETIWPASGAWTVSAPAPKAASKALTDLLDEAKKAENP